MVKSTTETQESTTLPIVDRTWLLTELSEWFNGAEPGERATLIGPPGIGKTWVARSLADRVLNSVYVNFAALSDREEWPKPLTREILGEQTPSLIILDSVEQALAAVWRTARLDEEFPTTPILFVFRPGVHFEGLQKPGCKQFTLTPDRPEQQEDLANYLAAANLESQLGLLSTFKEAEFLVRNPEQGRYQLDSYYLALWRETTRPLNGALRVLVEQVALLLADTPEGLPLETITDFTGIPAVQIREAIDLLSQVLAVDSTGVTLFSKGFGLFLTNHFSRDLGPVHGRIVSFFRETYPTWHEMRDAYGWRYLVLHCDRLARASRRQDFSILHWLNEGSFSMLKLERTGMLPSVLKDLRLSLIASLETRDIPRIIAFGHRIAKLRKHESVRTVHRLADSGEIAMARENAFLISGEGHRFLVWILFASQALEGGSLETTKVLLQEAERFPTLDLKEAEVELAASLIATMLEHPYTDQEHKSMLLGLLEMHGDPNLASLAFRTAGRFHKLTKQLRKTLFERGLASAKEIPFENSRTQRLQELTARLARLDGGKRPDIKAYPERLERAEDPEKEWTRVIKEVQGGILPIATAAASLIPFSDRAWSTAAYLTLAEQLEKIEDQEVLCHALSGLIQSLEDSKVRELDEHVQDGLRTSILRLDSPQDRSRFLARFAVMLNLKGRPLEAQQKISLAAANAFGVVDGSLRSQSLLHLAQQVAAMGSMARARDLTFHALELSMRADNLDRECRQLVLLLSSSSAQSESAEEIVRMGENLKFGDSPVEMEARGRALITLAAGLSRLGAEEQAQSYRDLAISTTRALADSELKIHLMSDLAAALHLSEEKKRARKLFKDARGLYESETFVKGLMSTTALLRLSMVLENQTQTKRFYEACNELFADPGFRTWLTSPSLLDYLEQAEKLGKIEEVLVHLRDIEAAEDLTDREQVGLLRCFLHLKAFQAAEERLERIQDLVLRCQAHVDIALSLLPVHAERSLEHLMAIPLESVRTEGIQRLALLNGAEIRPTEQTRVRDVLNHLTLMAMDHPDAMDAVLGRWLQSCPDRETLVEIAEKMGWSISQPQHRYAELFPQSQQGNPDSNQGLQTSLQSEPDSNESGVSSSDDGFQAIELTSPKK